MIDQNFRTLAKRALERAKTELHLNDDDRLKYAALELREALEALVYERATKYTEELPENEWQTWQARKLLITLVELDPYADQSGTLAYGEPGPSGEPPDDWKVLGHERRLSLREVKNYYDRLGSYTHTPTIKQLENNSSPTPTKIRADCSKLVTVIDDVLASKIFNIDLANKVEHDCARCKTRIVRRIHPKAETLEAKCPSCEAGYTLTVLGDGKVQWESKDIEMACANPECNHTFLAFESQVQSGVWWTCTKCRGKNTIGLSIAFTPKER